MSKTTTRLNEAGEAVAPSDCARPPFRPACKVIQDYEEARRQVDHSPRLNEARTAAVNANRLALCAGKSVVDLMEERLDLYIYTLMSDWVGEAAPSSTAEQAEYDQLKGRAQGVCEALALFANPYHPDQERVKALAMQRYREAEERASEDEE